MPGAMESWITSVLPPWLAKVGVIHGLAAVADQVRDDLLQGAREAMIEEASSENYPYHLRNSDLPVVAGEAPRATLEVLRTRWDRARSIGAVPAVRLALARLGFNNVQVWSTIDLDLAALGPAFGGNRGFFFVRVSQPSIVRAAALWNGGALWDGAELWGLRGITRAVLEDMIFAIRKAKPPSTSCRFIEFITEDAQAVRVPVGEAWEVDRNTGAFREFYHYSYTQERV